MTALRKVLVVDDDPVVGASFKRVLSGKGYLVVEADNGAAALERLKAEKFDAVFTDLRMPGMDGVQVAERVRAEQPWTPVVIVTGYGSAESEARARAAGVSEFLHKPLSPEAIEDSAAKAVRTVPTEAAPVAAPAEPAAMPEAAAPQPRSGWRLLRNMALFLVGPFIGLAYAVLLPFVGLGMIAALGWQAAMKNAKAREAARIGKMVLQFAAAPFIGLAWIVVMPFVGLAALALMAVKAVSTRSGGN